MINASEKFDIYSLSEWGLTSISIQPQIHEQFFFHDIKDLKLVINMLLIRCFAYFSRLNYEFIKNLAPLHCAIEMFEIPPSFKCIHKCLNLNNLKKIHGITIKRRLMWYFEVRIPISTYLNFLVQFGTKLYVPSTINTNYYILWHMKLKKIHFKAKIDFLSSPIECVAFERLELLKTQIGLAKNGPLFPLGQLS